MNRSHAFVLSVFGISESREIFQHRYDRTEISVGDFERFNFFFARKSVKTLACAESYCVVTCNGAGEVILIH